MLRLFLALAILLSLIPANVYAADEIPVQTIRYSFVTNPPIPVGQVIEFVNPTPGGNLVKWEERVQFGKRTHLLNLQGIRFTWDNVYPASPQRGAIGIVRAYYDWRDGAGEWVDEGDGIIDSMTVDAYREWTQTELRLLELGREFHSDLVAQNLVMISWGGDCPPPEIYVDGVLGARGPYAATYRVKATGSQVQGHWPKGICSEGKEVLSEPRLAYPGQTVSSAKNTSSILDQSPDYVCDRLEWMRPQWQPRRWVNADIEKKCMLFERTSDNPTAMLARSGFRQADLRSGDDHPTRDIAVFTYIGFNYGLDLQLPDYEWGFIHDQATIVDGTSYTVTLDEKQWWGTGIKIEVVGGKENYDSDIPYVDFGTPIVFGPRDMLTSVYGRVDWKKTEMIRVVMVDGTPKFQKIIWKDKK